MGALQHARTGWRRVYRRLFASVFATDRASGQLNAEQYRDGSRYKTSAAMHANHYTPDELQDALRPITSLISKSEKAQQRLAPGTWQHTMLQDNLKALHLASALMNKASDDPH